MNTVLNKLNRLWWLPPLVIHFFLTFSSVFYLYPEISLYPYLTAKGLIPYLDLIDQHFPILFFGPINLSQIGITTPKASLISFIIVSLLIQLGAILTLQKTKLKPIAKFTSFLFFTLSLLIFESNFYWIETFVILSLIWALYFIKLDKKILQIFAGILLGFIIGLRPPLFPFVALFIFLYRHRLKTFFYFGLIVIPTIQFIWLLNYHLLFTFLNQLSFNTEFYAPLASKLPSLRQLFIISYFFIPVFLYSSSPALTTVFAILLSAGAFPRFELFHLLPLTFLIILNFIRQNHFSFLPLFLWCLLITSFLLLKKPLSPTNFFYPQNLFQTANRINQLTNSSTIYLLGCPDQLYQLTNKLPPGNYYLPSLPWYFAKQEYLNNQLQALMDHPETPVLLNPNSKVDHQNLLDYARPIISYLATHYTKVETINGLELYFYNQQTIAKE